jgi:Flp pilus assembly CpaF family ATPase
MLSFFEDHKGLTVEAKGSRLLYYRNGIRIRPDKIQYFITEGLEILKLFKASKTV